MRLNATIPPNAETGSVASAFCIGFGSCFSQTYAGRICMLDDGTSSLFKIRDEVPCCIGVNVVVERHLLAGKHLGVGYASIWAI